MLSQSSGTTITTCLLHSLACFQKLTWTSETSLSHQVRTYPYHLIQFCFISPNFSPLLLLSLYTGNYWNEAQNRKRFFTDFAARNMFDASLASNWYPIATAALLGTKVAPCLPSPLVFFVILVFSFFTLVNYCY